MISYLETFGFIDIYLFILVFWGIYIGFSDDYKKKQTQIIMFVSMTVAVLSV